MKKQGKHYKQLNAEERATIMLMKREGSGLREIGRLLKRSPSTISNEIARDFKMRVWLRCLLGWRTDTTSAKQAS